MLAKLIQISLFGVMVLASQSAHAAGTVSRIVDQVQPRMVKVYGAGGLKRLEAYQSGFVISSDGHILTSWSYVLDSEAVTVVLADGRKMSAELVGADMRLEIAILKVFAADLPHFDLNEAAVLEEGDRVLAFSNLFNVAAGDEPATVQHGWISVKTALAARRGALDTPYRGPVYIVDAITNNPGAAGGALTNMKGQLAGVLGKELRKSDNDTWLNYSIPVAELKPAIDDILAGRTRPRSNDETAKKPKNGTTVSMLGIVLTPDVLHMTPPYVDRVRSGSPAEKAGIRPDDLILFVNRRTVQSSKRLIDELSYIDRLDEIRLTLLRDEELVDVVLKVDKNNADK